MNLVKKSYGPTMRGLLFVAVLAAANLLAHPASAAASSGRKHVRTIAGKTTDAKARGKKRAKTSKVANGAGPTAPTPHSFVDDRVSRVLRDLKGRPPRSRPSETAAITLPIWASKSQWLQAVYAKQLVDTSNSTGLLSDKLLFYEVAKRELGEKVDQYIVKTVGLRDFLVSEGLVSADGRLLAEGDKIEASLFKVFKSGVVARPAVGVAPRETGRGLFKDSDEFVAELLKPNSFLYRPDHRNRPVRSTVLDEVSSGEAIVLQEDLLMKPVAMTTSSQPANGTAKNSAAKPRWREVRVHTYEGRVVADANPEFWVRESHISNEETSAAQKFVGEFLSLLPSTMLTKQAFSFDVLIQPDGQLKIVDLVTNRGRKVGWSGYLDQPRVIGAYTRHFEQYAGVRFAGLAGVMLRKNAGNYFAFWGLRIDKSRPGFEKVLAWIPPWP